jgi:hypothetical protein
MGQVEHEAGKGREITVLDVAGRFPGATPSPLGRSAEVL